MLTVRSILNKNVFFIIICLLAGAAFSYAQESLELHNNEVIELADLNEPADEEFLPIPWYEGFFVEASGLVYFTPSLIKEYVKLGFGFRGALGYEFKRFRFALESGYSRVPGTDWLVSQVGFTPLVFKFGYGLPFFSIFGVQADVSAGLAFSKIMRYPTAIDHAMDKIREDSENNFIVGGRLYATVTPLDFLRIYAGGGVDVILEKEGPLVLPLVEIGVHFKPFALTGEMARQQAKALAAENERQRLLAEELARLEELARAEELARQQAEAGIAAEKERQRLLLLTIKLARQNIQFQADSAELHDSEKLKLQEIADILRDIPGVKILVEGHTAMARTEHRRHVFSRERAQAVASHLVSLGAVNEADVTVIGHGAERPIADHATEEGKSANRRVEITILEE
jgi:outer membrane protein OmpA-like peptidoglycan-associated protein